MKAEDLELGKTYRQGPRGTFVKLLAVNGRGRPIVSPTGYSAFKKAAERPILVLTPAELSRLEEV